MTLWRVSADLSGFNRYIVECKSHNLKGAKLFILVLIDT